MDTNTAIILVVALFALIIVGGFFIYRRRSHITIDTPLGKLDMDASSDPEPAPPGQPGVVVEDVKSRQGGVLAEDKTGRGVSVKKAEVETDILVSSENPDPKA
ncbi:MAG: hypothetical protein H6667_18305 [Ardenticatenaceae bacterium]|nr:hypothetical protein [Ardenticatenaceae bacterium]MCB9445774.1 hypothetical protein [Ardenticatenaceae bacterium]